MEQSLILVGSGGCMREIVWQIQEFNQINRQNSQARTWDITGYTDLTPPQSGAGEHIGGQFIPYLGNDDYLLNQTTPVNAAICTGSPSLRRKIAEKLQKNTQIQFPNLILGNTNICRDIRIGTGCIISMDARISTNVILGDFVFLNRGSGICHDGRIGDFVTLSPDVRLAGNVTIEDNCDIGLGTKVIQGVTIGQDTITGAGSVVINDIAGNCTVAGVPAKRIR